MDYLEIARKAKADFRKTRQSETETTQPLDEGRIVAALIESTVFSAEIWFALDENFKPDPSDDRAVFYASEIPLLRGKSVETLREIYKTRTLFGGGRVRQ